MGKRSLEPYTFNMGKRANTSRYENKRREEATFNEIQNIDSHYQQMSRPRFDTIRAQKLVQKSTKTCPNALKLLKSTKNK